MEAQTELRTAPPKGWLTVPLMEPSMVWLRVQPMGWRTGSLTEPLTAALTVQPTGWLTAPLMAPSMGWWRVRLMGPLLGLSWDRMSEWRLAARSDRYLAPRSE
jgi:hypothetical protein